MTPPALGTVGATGTFFFIIHGVVRVFNGTTAGLAQAAFNAGARTGDVVRADYGAGYRSYRLCLRNPAGRLWVERCDA
jgi:hypothetical protein